MNQHFEERRRQLASLLEKAENLKERILLFKEEESSYCKAEDVEDAKTNVDRCITCLTSYYNDYLN